MKLQALIEINKNNKEAIIESIREWVLSFKQGLKLSYSPAGSEYDNVNASGGSSNANNE